MFCIVDLQYPCFDTDFISPLSTTMEKGKCVIITQDLHEQRHQIKMTFSKMHTWIQGNGPSYLTHDQSEKKKQNKKKTFNRF